MLARHPLHTAHRVKANLPKPAIKSGKHGRDVLATVMAASDGSETEGVSEEEVEAENAEWTPKITREDPYAWKDDENESDDLPSTQLVDPRPLAGMTRPMTHHCKMSVCIPHMALFFTPPNFLINYMMFRAEARIVMSLCLYKILYKVMYVGC